MSDLQLLTEDQLISVLQDIAKGCTFEVITGPNPYNGQVYDTPHIWIMEFGRPFSVDLSELDLTAKEWFIHEIERLQVDMPWLAKMIIDKEMKIIVLPDGGFEATTDMDAD